jgi:hypothetical protein
LLVARREPDERVAQLPLYALEVQRSVAGQRSGAGEPRSAPRSTIVMESTTPPIIILRSSSAVTGPTEVRLFVHAGGVLREAAADVQQDEGGNARLVLSEVKELPERGTLIVLVSRPPAVEDPAKLRALALGKDDSGPGWQRFRMDYERVGSVPGAELPLRSLE